MLRKRQAGSLSHFQNIISQKMEPTVFNLDRKKAEVALKAGRLEEAFGLLDGSAAAEHAAGQQLKDQLVAAFVDRARQHLSGRRHDAARADVEMAKRLGGQQIDVLKLKQDIDAADLSVVRHDQNRWIETAVEKLEHLSAAGDHESVLRLCRTFSTSQRSAPAIEKLQCRSIQAAMDSAWGAFHKGRLDRCQRFIQAVARIDQVTGRFDSAELMGLLKKVWTIKKSIGRADYSLAIDELKRLQFVVADAVWIAGALNGLESCRQGIEEVMTGPLGLVGNGDRSEMNRSVDRIAVPADGIRQRSQRQRDDSKPVCGKSLLQVDSVGSLLMLCGDQFSIGTTSTTGAPDVVLQTEGQKEALYIRRSGEDYLAASGSPFVVNGKPNRQRLLSHGDSIDVGKRGRMTFLKSVAASNTAVLKIKGSKLDRRDIRWIVLVGDAVLFGDSGSHLRVAGLANRVIVRPVAEQGIDDLTPNLNRENRTRNEFLVHQQCGSNFGSDSRAGSGSYSNPQHLQPGETVLVGDCRFALTEIANQSSQTRQRSHS